MGQRGKLKVLIEIFEKHTGVAGFLTDFVVKTHTNKIFTTWLILMKVLNKVIQEYESKGI